MMVPNCEGRRLQYIWGEEDGGHDSRAQKKLRFLRQGGAERQEEVVVWAVWWSCHGEIGAR